MGGDTVGDIMSEKLLERACCKEARRRGFLPIKLVSPNMRGVPDRLLIGPNGQNVYIEFKEPGGKVRPEQDRFIRQLIRMGQEAHVIWSFDLFMVAMGWQD